MSISLTKKHTFNGQRDIQEMQEVKTQNEPRNQGNNSPISRQIIRRQQQSNNSFATARPISGQRLLPNNQREVDIASFAAASTHGAHSNEYNWQAARTTVKERLGYMFNNETLSDVHFVLGKNNERHRIPAHKFVLSIGSVVFDAMFNGGFGEQCNTSEIEIPDVEPAAFLSLLKFLYSDEVQIGPDNVMGTLYAAKKYAVPTLEAACVEFLKTNLGADNAFTLLSQARLFDEPQLAEMCLTCIDKNTVDALNAEGFTDIDSDTLSAVLERDSLGARESQLFEAAVRWGDHECRRQDIPNTPENKRLGLKKS